MFQVAYDYQKPWQGDKPLKVEIQLVQEITVSPTVAQRKANGFLAGYVTMMVSSGEPTLILSERPVWRIPAILKLPDLGEVGTVGTVDVDAQTGEILFTQPQLDDLAERGDVLAQRTPSPTG